MRCPYCQEEDTKVIDSRPADDGAAIRRRRECGKCRRRFKTFEKVEEFHIVVIKKDGSREFFDRQKIFSGILHACQKRPVSAQQIESVVSDIEREIINQAAPEVRSADIGEMVMEKLKRLDDVAYVRFASVYRQFQDVQHFLEELSSLRPNGKEQP